MFKRIFIILMIAAALFAGVTVRNTYTVFVEQDNTIKYYGFASSYEQLNVITAMLKNDNVNDSCVFIWFQKFTFMGSDSTEDSLRVTNYNYDNMSYDSTDVNNIYWDLDLWQGLYDASQMILVQ